jgi:hypothetical protein
VIIDRESSGIQPQFGESPRSELQLKGAYVTQPQHPEQEELDLRAWLIESYLHMGWEALLSWSSSSL